MGRGLFLALTGPVLFLGMPTPVVTPVRPLVTSSRAANTPPATVSLFRIETARGVVIWASDHPLQSGDQVTFHQHPDGALVSIRRSEILRVSAERVLAHAEGVVDVGVTGGTKRDAGGAGAKVAGKTAPGPGARTDGTALFNPDRKYQPDIDSKQVPGLNIGYPASPNDYREGRTFAYPAPAAVQSSPGDPPRMPDPPPPKPN